MSFSESSFAKRLDSFFHISERGSKFSTEIIGGLTTFMAMAYILMTNAGMFQDIPNATASYNAIYIATAISAIIGTVLIGLLSKLPLAQASGMGLNAFFVYTVCAGLGFTYANALVMVLIDGIIFIILTATGLRETIFASIPDCVRIAIPAGIGLFIAFLGLQNAGIVVADASTKVNLVSMNFLNGATWGEVMPVLVTFFTIIIIAILSHKGLKGAVIIGILGGAMLYYILMLTVPGGYDGLIASGTFQLENPFNAFADWGTESVGKVFADGFNFSSWIEANGAGNFVLTLVTTSIAFCLVDMFDTLGTLYGACARGNLLTETGDIPNIKGAMLADAIATTTGAICGTSTVTTFVESSSGIAAGARTGLSSMFTALCFFVAMFLAPIAKLIPTCATAACLIYIGVLMMNCVKNLDWLQPAVAVPSFLTIAMMPFTYSISYGIAFGLISYLFINLFSGKIKEIKIGTWVITILFAVMFFMTH